MIIVMMPGGDHDESLMISLIIGHVSLMLALFVTLRPPDNTASLFSIPKIGQFLIDKKARTAFLLRISMQHRNNWSIGYIFDYENSLALKK